MRKTFTLHSYLTRLQSCETNLELTNIRLTVAECKYVIVHEGIDSLHTSRWLTLNGQSLTFSVPVGHESTRAPMKGDRWMHLEGSAQRLQSSFAGLGNSVRNRCGPRSSVQEYEREDKTGEEFSHRWS